MTSGRTMRVSRRGFLRVSVLGLLSAGVLQACSSPPAAAPSKPAETKPAESKPAAPAAKTDAGTAKPGAAGAAGVPSGNVSLTFWNGLTGPDGKVLEEMLASFQSTYPNV